MNKKIKCAFILIMLLGLLVNVYAVNDVSVDFPTPSGNATKIRSSAETFWANFEVIIQILAVAAVVFAGIRYMAASADGRADLKKGLIFLVIGAVLVFATISVINLVSDAGNEILKY